MCYNKAMKILQVPTSKQDLVKESTNFIDDSTIKGAVDIKRELLAVDSPCITIANNYF